MARTLTAAQHAALAGPHRRGGPHRKDAAPTPAKHAMSTRYLRCPCCGARRREQAFHVPYHAVAWLLAAGGYKGIAWNDAPLSPDDRAMLLAALRRALAHLDP